MWFGWEQPFSYLTSPWLEPVPLTSVIEWSRALDSVWPYGIHNDWVQERHRTRTEPVKCLPLDFSDVHYRLIPFSFWSTSPINADPDLQATGLHPQGETKPKEWSQHTETRQQNMVLMVCDLLIPFASRTALPLPILCLIAGICKFFFWLNKFEIYSCYQKPNSPKMKVKWSQLLDHLFSHES